MKNKCIDCFRAALKSLTKEGRENSGKQYKINLAKSADVKLKTLNDIAMKRRVGSEDVRIKIAEALSYEYSNFLLLGDKLLEGLSLEEAIAYIKQQETLRIKQDGIIEEILIDWPELSKEQKIDLRNLCHEFRLKVWEHYKEMLDFDAHSDDRFRFIWSTVCRDAEAKVMFDENAFDMLLKYKKQDFTDWDILKQAEDFVLRQ